MLQIFCIETANQNRVVLLKEKYWNVLKACIYLSYIERVIPMNFMCIKSDQTGKKAYKVCQNAKFGLSLHITQSMDDEL